jgi:cellulose synthase/poly-beta-1,6-N-acetylglucosamine synthase-like glycosyltransferase
MIFLILIASYTVLIGCFIFGLDRLKNPSEILNREGSSQPFTSFSIVIPFRNEAERLPALLRSIAALAYKPEYFEVVLINDDSTDVSVKIIKEFVREFPVLTISVADNIRTSIAPKKDAITTAINLAKHEWIITTDADCVLPVSWLQSFHSFILKTKLEYIVAPVIYKTSSSFIDQYQLLDILSLQGITMGSFGLGKGLLCNGANLAYTKTLFKALNGFENNKHIASGDDIFMLENVQSQFPEKGWYLANKEAIVTTFPETSWKALISQRVRWAKKTGKQKSSLIKLIGLIVFAANLAVLLLPFYLFLYQASLWFGISALILKSIIDYLLLQKSGQFFGRNISVVHVFIHFYSYALVSTWVVLKSLFTNYTWKDRLHRH